LDASCRLIPGYQLQQRKENSDDNWKLLQEEKIGEEETDY